MKKLLFGAFAFALSLAALDAAAPPSAQTPISAQAAQAAGADEIDDTQDVLYVGQPHPVLIRLHLRIDRRSSFAHWDDCMAKYFAFLDHNDNKSLDRNELGKAPSAQQMLQFFGGNVLIARGDDGGRGRGPKLPVSITEFDTDRDGQVSLEEFKEYYLKHNAGPIVLATAQAVAGPRPLQPQQDGNMYAPPSSDQTDVVFALLDTNKDGKLSKEEMEAAEATLLRYDANDDELVSMAEIGLGGLGRNRRRVVDQQQQQQAAVRQPKQPAQPPQPPSNLILIGRDEGKRAAGKLAVARELISRYDKDKDGSLSMEEIGFSKKLYDSLDRNKDGKLSALELVNWLKGKPAGEFTVRLGGGRGAMMAPRDTKSMPAKRDDKKSDEMSLTVEGVRLKVVPQSSVVRTGVEGFLMQQFHAVDTEKRGFITRKQVQGNDRQNAILNNMFDLADRDSDGKLTEKELKAGLQTMTAMQGAQLSVSFHATGNGLFQMLDANGDGQLSIRELRAAPKRLMELDRDGDGYVSRSEFPQQFQLTVGQGGLANGGFGIDQPMQAPDQGARSSGRGPLWFVKMDRNNDGVVSPKEWLGEKEDFDAIDSDHDGLISAEEAEAYDAKARK